MAGSGGAADLEVNEVPDLSLDGAAAAALKCQVEVEELCVVAADVTCKYEIDPKASAAGDYREDEMLVAQGNLDKELCVANGNEGSEAAIVSEHIAVELCENRYEQNFVAVENRHWEDFSLAHTDELPAVAVEQNDRGEYSPVHTNELQAIGVKQKDDADPSLICNNELPTVDISSKDDEEPSLSCKEERPTVVAENEDCLHEVEIIDVNHLTDSAICDMLLTDDIDNAQRHSPNTVGSSEEQSFIASGNEEKYLIAGIQDEAMPVFPGQQDELHPVAIDDKGIFYRDDGEQILEDSGQLLTNSVVLEASFTSHDSCADIGDIDISVDSFISTDNTDTIDLLGHASNGHATKMGNKPNTLSDVQFSDSDTVTVTDSPLDGSANYVIDVGDKPLDKMTKPSDDSSQTPTGTGDVNRDTHDGETGAMVAIDAECESIVITSIADAKHDSEDEEFGFEVDQNKDICLSHQGSGEHASVPKVVDLDKPKKAEDVSVPVTSDVESQPSSSATTQVSDKTTKSEALREAEAEWTTVEEMTAGFGAGGDYVVGKRTATELISYDDALQTMCQSDITRYQPRIQTTVRRRGFAALKYILCGPPTLHEDLVADRDLAFCMAACPFSNDDVVHLRTLQTIYRKLTGSRFDCPRYGTHWEQIGFQGTDPATDLRGVGFLALLHLLYALTTPQTAHIIHDIYKLSHDEVQNFPLCIMSINMTRIAMQGLREGCLNKWCNHGNQVVAVLSDFYVGTFLQMYHVWKHERKTIRDSGFVLQDVEKYVKKHPAMVLRTLEAHAQSPRQRRSPSPPTVNTSPLCPEESSNELDEMPVTEDTSSKNFFTICKDEGDDNLGNLI